MTLLLLTLFAYRVTRLVTTDDITATLREWATMRPLPEISDDAPRTDSPKLRERKYLHGLLTCDYCAGWWVSLATVLIVDAYFVPLPMPLLWAGAVSTVVGVLGQLSERLAR